AGGGRGHAGLRGVLPPDPRGERRRVVRLLPPPLPHRPVRGEGLHRLGAYRLHRLAPQAHQDRPPPAAQVAAPLRAPWRRRFPSHDQSAARLGRVHCRHHARGARAVAAPAVAVSIRAQLAQPHPGGLVVGRGRRHPSGRPRGEHVPPARPRGGGGGAGDLAGGRRARGEDVPILRLWQRPLPAALLRRPLLRHARRLLRGEVPAAGARLCQKVPAGDGRRRRGGRRPSLLLL
ncbi:hypothetical protein EMIHUDRAFT_458405, partial [Emiliania huxleyi CCMP1516]